MNRIILDAICDTKNFEHGWILSTMTHMQFYYNIYVATNAQFFSVTFFIPELNLKLKCQVKVHVQMQRPALEGTVYLRPLKDLNAKT